MAGCSYNSQAAEPLGSLSVLSHTSSALCQIILWTPRSPTDAGKPPRIIWLAIEGNDHLLGTRVETALALSSLGLRSAPPTDLQARINCIT